MNMDALTAKKVGGIPVIWLALGIAVIGLYAAIKSKGSKTATPADATNGTAPDIAGDSPDTTQPVFQATPTITQPSGVTTSVTAVSGPDTDTLWERRAIEYLIPTYGLSVATSAITKYLNGEALNATEAQARDAAVRNFGIPPESVPDAPGVATTPTTPTYNGPAAKQGNPPTIHTVRGTSDDSYRELAALYYGRSTYIEWNTLKGANPGLTEPFRKGTPVHIPRFIQPEYYRATSATRGIYQIAQKNGTTAGNVQALNPNKHFPVAVGTRVRVR